MSDRLDVNEFEELCKHGFYIEAFFWVDENLSYGTPDYFFYRACACAYLDWYEEIDLPVGITWEEEAMLSLWEFIDLVQDDILKAIGWGFLAEIEFNEGNYAGALRSMSLALMHADDDTDIVRKADQLMWEIGSRLSGSEDLSSEDIDDNYELWYDPDPEDEIEDDDEFHWTEYSSMPSWWYADNAVEALISVGTDSIHEN